uniref:Uncharacterized protein n=1 Tax=Arundo donax TaxID=35708 RepID=A0A0A9A9U1_ARUDO
MLTCSLGPHSFHHFFSWNHIVHLIIWQPRSYPNKQLARLGFRAILSGTTALNSSAFVFFM